MARGVARVRDNQELRKRERETRADERRIFREDLARRNLADKKSWNRGMWNKKGSGADFMVKGISREIRRNRLKVRTQLRMNLKKLAEVGRADDWEWLMSKMRRVRMAHQPLEIKGDYSVHDGAINKWTIDGVGHRDPQVFLKLCDPLVERVVLDAEGPVRKVEVVLDIALRRPGRGTEEGEDETDDHGFRSGVRDITRDSDFEDQWLHMTVNLLTGISKHQGMGSGWILEKVNRLTVHVDLGNPIAGSSYIQLPEWVRSKRAVVNVKNKGDDCFPLAVATAEILRMHPDMKYLHRIPKILKKKVESLNMGDLKLPMDISDIPKFEELNPTLSVAVYGIHIGKEEIVPIAVGMGRARKGRDVVNLLFWGDGNGNNHYAAIKNFSALTAGQVSKNMRKTYTCPNCFHRFRSAEDLAAHEEDGLCYEHECQQTLYVGEVIKFKGHRKTQRVPFAVYSDIESFNVAIEPPDKPKNTVKMSEQTPSGLGYCIVGPLGYESVSWKFDTAAEYATSLAGDVRKIYHNWFSEKARAPLNMTPENTTEYDKTRKCYQCGRSLIQGLNKVRDHDHFTGEFRGAACTPCNLLMKKPGFIPVYFHNLEGYDSHLLIREVSKLGKKMDCIPRDRERYISFNVRIPLNPGFENSNTFELRFLDSMKLMNSGLAGLVATLGEDDLAVTRGVFPDLTGEQLKLLRRKGVYPYDWVDGPEKLGWRELPPIDDFYNRLSESPCSESDHKHAQSVWESFGMETMQDYHDLYLKSDITLLADVVEKFRVMCRETYGLDPSWYYTTPGLSWDAMLKMTGVKLKTMSDPDIHLFVEGATRGGISVITKRHAVANHKYMDSHDPDKPSTFISYLDMNNLYGCAMEDPLPEGDLEWMDPWELRNWTKVVGPDEGEDTGRGCFLEVDLEYPAGIHDLHSDYPMACERMAVGEDASVKLVPNLYDKTKYVMHHDELRQCLAHGLILKKVHRGVKFTQSRWLAKYIGANTKLRTESKTKFGQDFYKLMNNAVFGKTMEDVRKRVDVKITRDTKKIKRLVSKSNYKGTVSFAEHPDEINPLVAVEMGKPKVKMSKPVYVGAAVLSISKVRMYEFFYEYVKPKWGDRVDLLFTDTNSLCMEIQTEDFYADIIGDVGTHFDTSNIPSDHRAAADLGFPTGVNNLVLGMMKDEAGGRNIVEYVGLRPKMYAIKMEGDDDVEEVWRKMDAEGDRGDRPSREGKMKCKGVKEYVTKKMMFDEYRKCLYEKSPVYKSQNTLRNRNHRIYVERMTKKALCGNDNKRIILEDGIKTLPWGHYSTRTTP